MPRDIIPLPPLEGARGYSPTHAALYLDCSVPTVYALLVKKRLASRLLGKRRIIPGSELIRFLTGQEPIMAGDPIDKRMSDLGRIGGKAGGLAKARNSRRKASSESSAAAARSARSRPAA
jgi:excisionase family DNA binding protein